MYAPATCEVMSAAFRAAEAAAKGARCRTALVAVRDGCLDDVVVSFLGGNRLPRRTAVLLAALGRQGECLLLRVLFFYLFCEFKQNGRSWDYSFKICFFRSILRVGKGPGTALLHRGCSAQVPGNFFEKCLEEQT